MTLIKWNPAREIFNVEREFNKLLNSFSRNFDLQFSDDHQNEDYWSPRADIIEDTDNYVINLDIPGVKKDDIKLTVNDGELTISGERASKKEEKGKTFHRIEKSYGKYLRSFPIPKNVMSDKINASYKDGILEVTLPKSEESKPKELEIKVK